ncbi:MAG: DUF2141 domain-containing protein [Pseudomonadota bacterium]
MNALMKTAFAAATLLSLNLAHAADLTIHIDDVKSTSGNVLVAVYNSEGSFLKQPAKTNGTAAATPGSTVVIKDLPEGEYAFAVYHDANANGKMDKNIIGIPTEDYAFSNNAMGKMGPPNYASARITVAAAGTTARVSLK